MKPIVTAEQLRAWLHYDVDTGAFRWKARASSKSRAQIGERVGSVNDRGYLRIALHGRPYQAHRLAWLYVHGVWPTHTIDHINRDKSDNRIANLRDVPTQTNNQNRLSLRELPGACQPRGKWQATIKAGRRNVFLGRFDSPEAASAAYLAAKGELHDGFAR